jgi:hypothetical protein
VIIEPPPVDYPFQKTLPAASIHHIVNRPGGYMNHHKTTIHARCPYAPVWDYYTVIVETPDFLKCERLQEVCEEIRGKEMTQEQVFEHLKSKIYSPAKITVKGRHGQNGRLVIGG